MRQAGWGFKIIAINESPFNLQEFVRLMKVQKIDSFKFDVSPSFAASCLAVLALPLEIRLSCPYMRYNLFSSLMRGYYCRQRRFVTRVVSARLVREALVNSHVVNHTKSVQYISSHTTTGYIYIIDIDSYKLRALWIHGHWDSTKHRNITMNRNITMTQLIAFNFERKHVKPEGHVWDNRGYYGSSPEHPCPWTALKSSKN